MIITIASYLASTILPFALYQGYLRYINRNIPKVLATPPEPAVVEVVELPPSGLSVIEYNIPEETEEQYLKRLKYIHSEAWQEYQNTYKSRKLLEAPDRFVNLLLLKLHNGEVSMECRQHTMRFSEGTEIWIANKYYGYGNVYECKRPGIKFESCAGRLSPYTFMKIVDLNMERTNFAEWKQHHDDYSRRRVTGIKALLSK